ncbi:DUF3747 domain-containing protein [Synechococcus sp. UW179A]|uniref:DUF3747 domain-containing protein n=1 Tax=Synechococcus sp. UW179A TaxID=2575510 RepID=UPI000E0E1FF8|nr:DUF3747 domain-containing protein [Synechococcus sp. UW179A]
MGRTYFRRAALSAGAVGLAAIAGSLPGWARALFDSSPLQEERFAILAQAVGPDRWKLLVLEQIKARPLCWEERQDGLMNPSLNNFDFTGICSRYLDSNGYSLRTSGRDVDKRYRLRLNQSKNGLALQATDSVQGDGITVARASKVRRDKNAFVKLTLEPGWSLERRSYKGRTLSHVYFAHKQSMNTLMAANKGKPVDRSLTFTASMPKPPSQPGGRRLNQQRGPIRLTVIPFRP